MLKKMRSSRFFTKKYSAEVSVAPIILPMKDGVGTDISADLDRINEALKPFGSSVTMVATIIDD